MTAAPFFVFHSEMGGRVSIEIVEIDRPFLLFVHLQNRVSFPFECGGFWDQLRQTRKLLGLDLQLTPHGS